MYVMYILHIVNWLLTWSFSPPDDSHNYHHYNQDSNQQQNYDDYGCRSRCT